MYTPLRAHTCARLCVGVCVCVSSEPAKCQECTQLVKKSRLTHLSTCADNGPQLCAYICTLINQSGPLISQSGNLMTSYSMVSYTREEGEEERRATHVQTLSMFEPSHTLCVKHSCNCTEDLVTLEYNT